MCCLVYICNKTFLYLMVNVDEFRLHPHMVPSETLVPSCQFIFFYILIYFTDTGYTHISLKNILIFQKHIKKSLFFYRQATLYSIHMTKKKSV